MPSRIRLPNTEPTEDDGVAGQGSDVLDERDRARGGGVTVVSPPSAVRWMPEELHRHRLRVLRGWVIALAVIVGVGTLIIGALLFRAYFTTTPFPVVVSSPRECRLSDDTEAPRLYIAVDVTTVIDGSLDSASPVRPRDGKVKAVGLVSSLAQLSSFTDAEFERIVEEASQNPSWFGDNESTGVVVAIVETDGQNSGALYGLRTVWVLGEPAVEQDLPLGITFTPISCAVTTAG